jgi:hypothetical protein
MASEMQYWDRIVAKARGSRAEHLTNEDTYRLGVRAVCSSLFILHARTAANMREPNEITATFQAKTSKTLDETTVICKSDRAIGSVKMWVHPEGTEWLTVDGPNHDEGPVTMLVKPSEEVTLIDAERVALAADIACRLVEHCASEGLVNYIVDSVALD